MARHRTPSNVLDSRGAFKKDPSRKRTDAADDRPLGAAPTHLTDAVRACWDEIASQATPGVLAQSDRISVEIASVVLTKVRDGSAKGGDFALLANLLGRFGMSPADRSRVQAVKAKTPSVWDDL